MRLREAFLCMLRQKLSVAGPWGKGKGEGEGEGEGKGKGKGKGKSGFSEGVS